MAGCQKQFEEFNSTVALAGTMRDDLRKSKRADEKRIEKSFKDAERAIPDFREQGSLPISTAVEPENKDDEYDLDDGVILQNLDSNDDSDWVTTETAHKWVMDALKDATDKGPTDKQNCVRLTYAKNYHVDFPIYAPFRGASG